MESIDGEGSTPSAIRSAVSDWQPAQDSRGQRSPSRGRTCRALCLAVSRSSLRFPTAFEVSTKPVVGMKLLWDENEVTGEMV